MRPQFAYRSASPKRTLAMRRLTQSVNSGADELMTMLLAGHETTATGLAFAFDLLMREPRVLSRLRDELGGEDDTYLDAVVTKSLRLRPVIDANERTLTKPRTIAGWDLPAGIRVYRRSWSSSFAGISTRARTSSVPSASSRKRQPPTRGCRSAVVSAAASARHWPRLRWPR